MHYYIGLDISNKETSVCIVDENNKVKRQFKVKSDPDSIVKAILKTGLEINLIGLEAGALSFWLMKGLLGYKLPVKCIDSRRMAAILKTKVNKTDRNDAKEIAIAMKNGNYVEVHQKSQDSMEKAMLISSRKTLVEQITTLKNTVRGLLKGYGIKLGKNQKNKQFIEEVNGSLAFDQFSSIKQSEWDYMPIRTLLSCIEKLSEELDRLGQKIKELAKTNKLAKQFETIDGIGPITALSYIVEIDDPKRFKNSRSVGAYLGLTPSQYSSGEVLKQGRISKCGSKDLRALLVEAGMVILTHTSKWSKLRAFGLRIWRKTRSKMKAAVAIARKLAVIMHRMWVSGAEFIRGEPTEKQLKDSKKLEKLMKDSKKKNQHKEQIEPLEMTA